MSRVSCTSRHLLFLFLSVVLTVFTCLGASNQTAAQDKPNAQAVKAKPPAQPELAVPSAENLVIMIRSTLLSLNDALATGNFTVFRDLAAPSLRDGNSAARFAQIFSNLADQHINLARVVILAPKLPGPPAIDANRRLHISGFFPDDPVQINFELQFEEVSDRWRLFGIAVNPVKSASTAAVPAPADLKKTTPQTKAGK